MRARVGNIGPRGRAQRLRMGVVAIALGTLLVVLLIALGAGPGWVLGAFVPFFVGALGLIQARDGT
ncbi:MAG: hypothetical protein ACREKB_10090 [Candidatus Rokuibacteriota bacterium]